MNYSSMKVKDAMLQISTNEIYLPAIQRKFVWDIDRIEKLFDSIMRGYPIGTFLFWFVEGKSKDDYTFYKFIQDYHERDRAWNEVAPKPDLREKFIGVLDGQQRLNSMYVALQGSYAYRRKHGRWTDDGAFPQRFLYLNLFYKPGDDDENGVAYEFSFLTTEEAKVVDDGHFWFQVKKAIAWKDQGPVFAEITQVILQHQQHQQKLQTDCGPLLTTLWQRLCADDVINFFSIREQELDKVVDIFVRVNSAGVQLSKTDLLFSSIVAHWDEGRSKIEATITTLNAKGDRFSFDNDFVMRSCLALSDLPIRFKVNSFKKENIESIKSNWPEIKKSLESMVDLLVEWGFCGDTLPTLNAVIPIAYFIFKGGDVGNSKPALQQYLVRALLNQIFASKTDRVLGAIRDHLRIAKVDGQKTTYTLSFPVLKIADMLTTKLPDVRTLAVTDADIEELLNEGKGPYTFMVLSLLYPQLKFDQVKFHQDHIHPWSQFRTSDLKKLGLGDATISQWQDERDRLPNLQLMEGATNQSKNDTAFETWILTLGAAKDHFMKSNYIPDTISLKLVDFEKFFATRRDLLRTKVKEALKS
jgi:uncharacterized protein DUF262